MTNHDTPLMRLIRTRRSLRRYTEASVPQALIERLLEAARWSPSAHNRQPWRFAVIASQAAKVTLAQRMGERLRHDLQADGMPPDLIAAEAQRSYERLTSAPILLLACLSMADMDKYPDMRRMAHEQTMAVQSVAMAAQNVLLAAHEAGLGACWMCAPLFCPDVVLASLELPIDWQPQGLISLGWPAQTREKAREPIETRVLWR